MKFSEAVNNEQVVTTTLNGGSTLSTSMNALVDLFFLIGAVRGKEFDTWKQVFDAAFAQNPKLTLQIVLWARDVRSGAGERQVVRDILKYLEQTSPEHLETMIPHIPTFGRWDDILIFEKPELKSIAYSTISTALNAGDALAAKWMPREMKLKRYEGKIKDSTANRNRTSNNKMANEIAAHMGITPRAYRKLLASLSSTVEQQMCSSQWESIEYSKVPSLASKRYVQAFARHDAVRYGTFVKDAAEGVVKVNAGALYPHDVIVPMYNSESSNELSLLKAQWESLPNFMGDNSILPMVDTSGSMADHDITGNLTVQDIAVSLGLYVSTKQTGAFKDLWLNFSTTPRIKTLANGDIVAKVRDLYRNHSSDWDGSTDVHAAFRKVLEVAVTHNVPAEEMPKILMIFSDMEFDHSGATSWNDTAYNQAVQEYKQNGYELPTVVFWNLNGRVGNVPVKFDQKGTALVSGFSPNLMKSLLTGNLNPVQVMLDTVDVERYRVL